MQQYREASPERSQLLRILTHVLFGLEAIDEELVFKCSEKIYEEEPALVLRCFVDDKGVIGHLNIYHTAQHLQRLTQREPSAYRRNALPIQYLSVVTPHIPAGTGSLRLPEDHNLAQILALLYIETINEAEAFCRQNEPFQPVINERKRKNPVQIVIFNRKIINKFLQTLAAIRIKPAPYKMSKRTGRFYIRIFKISNHLLNIPQNRFFNRLSANK